MMFTAAIGGSVIAWGFAEPIFYLQTPPMGIEVGSAKSFEWAAHVSATALGVNTVGVLYRPCRSDRLYVVRQAQ